MLVFVQLVLSGIAVGSIYALVALGFVLIYKATRVINFAQGELVLLGAFAAFAFLAHVGLPPWIALPLTLLIALLFGVVIEWLALRPMIGEPIISVIMLTVGLASFLRGGARAMALTVWGTGMEAFPWRFPRLLVRLGDVVIPSPFVWSFLISAVFLVVFALFFKYTSLGIVMRATANDQTAAMSLGIGVKRVFALAWGVAASVAAVGGILLGNINVIDMGLGLIGLKVFPVVILGGLDSILGAIVGGVLIGVLENLAGAYLQPILGGGIKVVAPFVVLLLIVLIKPYGLFGTEEVERL